ncbi:MAG: hypothetical protein ACO2ZU_07110, partial [Burkholderiaceae bacterium]
MESGAIMMYLADRYKKFQYEGTRFTDSQVIGSLTWSGAAKKGKPRRKKKVEFGVLLGGCRSLNRQFTGFLFYPYKSIT